MSAPLNRAWLASRLSRDRLPEIFRKSERPGPGLIGLEHEKISFRLQDGGPVPYFGPNGIHRLMLELCTRFGWEPEHTEGFLLSLKRGDAHITLEPGGQVELSGSPLGSLRQVKRELAQHLAEVSDAGLALGIGLSELGMHPLRDPRVTEFVPKPRYPIMRRYFQSSGGRGAFMMAATATVQVNLDFSSEAEAMEKLRAAQLASPFISAVFANSPYELGRDTGQQSRRYATWLDVDPARQGLLAFLYRENASYDDYVAWALAAPMFGVHRGDEFLATPIVPFEQFLDLRGGGPLSPVMEDWYDHLGTLYPETRLKRTIELRGADSGGLDHAIAVAAVWRGLLDHAPARRHVIGLVPEPASPRTLQADIAARGLYAEHAGARAIDWASEIVRTAKAGLYALGDDLAGSALGPAEEGICEGMSPADLWRKRLGKAKNPIELLTGTRLLPSP